MPSISTTPFPSTSDVGSILVPLDVLSAVLKDLNIDVNAQEFVEKVSKHSVSNPTGPARSRTRKEVHAAAIASLTKSTPPPSPQEGVVKRVNPSAVDPAIREKRRKMLADTRAAFRNEVPTPFVVSCWAGGFDNLQFIQAQVVVSSDDESVTQTFNEWCLWDTGAQITMMRGDRLNADVKGGADVPSSGFLQAEITFAGVTTPKIDYSIGYRPQLPNDSQYIILGQRTLIECIEYYSTPKSFFPEGTVAPDNTYGTISYADPVDDSIHSFD